MGGNPYAEPVGREHVGNVCFIIMILQASSNGLYMSRMQANFAYTFHKSTYAMIYQHSISLCQFYKTLLLTEKLTKLQMAMKQYHGYMHEDIGESIKLEGNLII